MGFPDSEDIPSELTPDAKDPNALAQEKTERVGSAILFDHYSDLSDRFRLDHYSWSADRIFALARYTHIIRDAAAPRRPDGQRPYSLARGQMAFWFFLVIASYFFLWIVTGDMNTLNTSVLALIGISAGTALGSAFVDAAKPVSVELSRQ